MKCLTNPYLPCSNAQIPPESGQDQNIHISHQHDCEPEGYSLGEVGMGRPEPREPTGWNQEAEDQYYKSGKAELGVPHLSQSSKAPRFRAQGAYSSTTLDSLTKYKFKGKMIQNFKSATTEQETLSKKYYWAWDPEKLHWSQAGSPLFLLIFLAARARRLIIIHFIPNSSWPIVAASASSPPHLPPLPFPNNAASTICLDPFPLFKKKKIWNICEILKRENSLILCQRTWDFFFSRWVIFAIVIIIKIIYLHGKIHFKKYRKAEK